MPAVSVSERLCTGVRTGAVSAVRIDSLWVVHDGSCIAPLGSRRAAMKLRSIVFSLASDFKDRVPSYETSGHLCTLELTARRTFLRRR